MNTTNGNLTEFANRAFPLEAQLLQHFCDSLGVMQNDSLQASKLSIEPFCRDQDCWIPFAHIGSGIGTIWNNDEQWPVDPCSLVLSCTAQISLATQEVLKLTTLSDLIKLLVLNLLVTGTWKRIMSDRHTYQMAVYSTGIYWCNSYGTSSTAHGGGGSFKIGNL